MRIACLAWGSLVWKWQPLVLSSGWQPGGPALPIEFGRVGDQGELATAICDGAATPNMPTQWALLETGDLDEAREQLRRRESIDVERRDAIGIASATDRRAPHAEAIAAWAAGRRLDAVVWTALPPRFADCEGRMPSVEEALGYLAGLRGPVREHAEQYVRRVPAAIRTPYRAAFEARLGWHAAA